MGYIYVFRTQKAIESNENIYKIGVTNKTMEECMAGTKNQFKFFMPVSAEVLKYNDMELAAIRRIAKISGIKYRGNDSYEGKLCDITRTIIKLVHEYEEDMNNNDEDNKETFELVNRDDIDSDYYLSKSNDDKDYPYIYRYTYDNKFKFYYVSYREDVKMTSVYEVLNTDYNVNYKNIREENDTTHDIASKLQELIHKSEQKFVSYDNCVKIVSYFHNNKDVIEEILKENKEHLDNDE